LQVPFVGQQAQDAAREAFLTAYRVAYGAVLARLGDPKAAKAVFPDLGKTPAAEAGAGGTGEVPAGPVGAA